MEFLVRFKQHLLTKIDENTIVKYKQEGAVEALDIVMEEINKSTEVENKDASPSASEPTTEA